MSKLWPSDWGDYMAAEKKLTRAEFFNYLIKKSIQKAAQVGDEFIQKAGDLGLAVNKGVVLCSLSEVTATPKKFTYNSNDYFLWAWKQSFALTYTSCPVDRFPLLIRQTQREFFCPLCQRSWSFDGDDWREIGEVALDVVDGKVLLRMETQSTLGNKNQEV